MKKTVVVGGNEGSKRYATDMAVKMAKEGPRVSAVAVNKKRVYFALPGFMDYDTVELKQILLVTPDGRAWKPTKSR